MVVWTNLEDREIGCLTKFFHEIMRSKEMLDKWRRSTLISIYKKERYKKIVLTIE